MGKVSYTEEINVPPERVWAILTDPSRLPDWAYTEGRFPYIVEGKFGSDQQEGPGTVWVGTSADGQVARQQVTGWEPEKRLIYELQEMENAAVKMAQINTFDLVPVKDNVTEVTWTVDWKLTGGFSLNTLLLRLTGNGAFEEMIAGSLENLKRLVEADAANPPAEA